MEKQESESEEEYRTRVLKVEVENFFKTKNYKRGDIYTITSIEIGGQEFQHVENLRKVEEINKANRAAEAAKKGKK